MKRHDAHHGIPLAVLLKHLLKGARRYVPKPRKRQHFKTKQIKYGGPLHSHCPICGHWCKTHDGVRQHIEAKHVVDDVRAA